MAVMQILAKIGVVPGRKGSHDRTFDFIRLV
jgi:hypothetical protein